MRCVLELRKRQHPFEYQQAEQFTLDGQTDPMLNNSYYFSAHDENLSVFARLGKRVRQEETWFAFYRGGKLYSLQQETFPAGASPLSVQLSGDQWSISFQGIVNKEDKVDFQARFIPRQEPIDFTTNMPSERMAIGLANEKWSRELFSSLQTISGQCHYEQEGLLEGSLTVNGESTNFCLPCVRDHSFGKRDWDYMNNHLWLMAVAPDRQLNYSLVSYPALSLLEVGNYRDAAGQHYLLQADLDLAQLGTGTVPGELSFQIRLDNKRVLPVQAQVLSGVSYHFQEGQYILHENIASFDIDGKPCRGILEIGFNRINGRFFNQRTPDSFRR